MSNKNELPTGGDIPMGSDGNETNNSDGQNNFTTEPPPIQASNVFEAAAARRGSLTPAQENFLARQDRETLASARLETGIHKPITRLSKRAAWFLIRAIKTAEGEQ